MPTESPSARQTDHLPLDHGYLFSESGMGRKIDAKAAIEWLKHRDGAGEKFIWLQFHDVPTVLGGWPVEHVELPEAFGDTLKEASRSTRIEHVQKNLIAVVNDVDYNFEREKPLKVATLWLNVGARCLLSVRSLPLRSVDQLRLTVERGETFHSPMGPLIHLLQQQADALLGIVGNSAQTANSVEEMLLAGKLPTRSSLGGIRRDLVRLRRLLAPEPGALFRLVNRPPHWVREDDAQSLRHSAEEFSLTLRDMAGLQERIEMLEEDIADRVGEHTNRSVLILTAVTVIALPTNLIAGLMGMNVGGLPLRYDNKGFRIVAMMWAVLTSLAAWLIFRRRQD